MVIPVGFEVQAYAEQRSASQRHRGGDGHPPDLLRRHPGHHEAEQRQHGAEYEEEAAPKCFYGHCRVLHLHPVRQLMVMPFTVPRTDAQLGVGACQQRLLVSSWSEHSTCLQRPGRWKTGTFSLVVEREALAPPLHKVAMNERAVETVTQVVGDQVRDRVGEVLGGGALEIDLTD